MTEEELDDVRREEKAAMTPPEEPLPCQCGAGPVVYENHHWTYPFGIWCRRLCGEVVEADTRAEAVARWNQRNKGESK